MWFRKHYDTNTPVMDTDAYAKLLNRIVERDADLSTLKAKITALQLDVDNFNRRLGTKLRELSKEATIEKEENILKDDNVYFG